jgi:hypothetical protein
LSIWPSNDGSIYGITRSITFKSPVPSSAIRLQFVQTYGQVLGNDLATVSSRADCQVSSLNYDGIQHHLDAIKAIEDNATSEISTGLLGTASACPVGYHISFAGGSGQVSAVQLAFFDSTSVLRQAHKNDVARAKADEQRRQTEEAQKKQNLDKVTTDLKL